METEPEIRDAIIIGGGPAGMSAAVWCADLGLKPVLLERYATLGGQLHWTHNPITNYLGTHAKDGADLAGRFAEHIRQAGIETVPNADVVSADLAAKRVIADGVTFRGRAIVIATGVRRRKLGVPGEEEFAGRGIVVSGARDRESFREKSVVIVGGGDAALENAILLSGFANKVRVVHRRSEFAARAEFVARAREMPNIQFSLCSVVTCVGGSEHVDHVATKDAAGATTKVTCDAVLVRIGVDPNTELFEGQIELDERGYVIVDNELRASRDGVWAIGDVVAARSKTIARAVGNGAEAAKSILDIVSG